MGATLRFAKVVDEDRFLMTGGTIRPGLDSVVVVHHEPPARTAAFRVAREWVDFDGAFTETWRIEDPHGRTLREGVAREILPGMGAVTDEIDDLTVDYADEDYQLVLEIDGREVARVGFPVVADAAGDESADSEATA